MGVKRRRGTRATKRRVGIPAGEPGGPDADPCASTWEFLVGFNHEVAPHITIGSPVSLYPKAGGVAIMIGTREIGVLVDPAVPQLIACMERGYVYTGVVTEVDSKALQAKIEVTGTRSTE